MAHCFPFQMDSYTLSHYIVPTIIQTTKYSSLFFPVFVLFSSVICPFLVPWFIQLYAHTLLLYVFKWFTILQRQQRNQQTPEPSWRPGRPGTLCFIFNYFCSHQNWNTLAYLRLPFSHCNEVRCTLIKILFAFEQSSAVQINGKHMKIGIYLYVQGIRVRSKGIWMNHDELHAAAEIKRFNHIAINTPKKFRNNSIRLPVAHHSYKNSNGFRFRNLRTLSSIVYRLDRFIVWVLGKWLTCKMQIYVQLAAVSALSFKMLNNRHCVCVRVSVHWEIGTWPQSNRCQTQRWILCLGEER